MVFLKSKEKGLVELIKIRVIWIFGKIDGGNGVFLFGPSAEINLFAALRTERAESIFRYPSDFGPTGWAVDNSSHGDKSEVTESEVEWNVALKWFRFHIAILRHDTDP